MNDLMSIPVPSVIRSRQHLASQGAAFFPAGLTASAGSLPIGPDGITYGVAQEAAWLDAKHVAVGRWDGSLSIFSFNDSKTAGPIITKAINTPAFEGVQSITRLALLGSKLVYGHLGSALAFHPCGNLVVVNYNLYEFVVPTGPRARER